MIDKLMEKIIKMCKSEPNLEIKFPDLMKGLNETDDEYRKRIREYIEVQQDDKKQVLIKELSYIVDLGDTENEIYDNLQALLEVLRVQEIISNEAYEQAEIKVSKIWGLTLMTDKPIIIDGINVDECECSSQIDLDANIICTSNFPSKKSGYCKDNPNCLFKQLARKTHKCEELTKNYIMVIQQRNVAEQQLDQLKAENKQYKETVDNLLKIQYKLADTSNKYNQKFEKIREYCNKYPQNSIGFKKNILQIINEVEE